MICGPEHNNFRILPANGQRSELRLFIAENNMQLSGTAAEFLAERIEKSFSHTPMFLREGSPAVGISFFAPDRKRSMSLQKPIPTLDFLGSASDCFTVAFSGGSTPRGLFQRLAREPYFSRIPWEKLDIWWVDERCVSFDSPESNYGNARHDLIRKIPSGQDRIHPMPADQDPQKGAAAYEAALMRCFGTNKGEFPVFDLIFLGMGEDGHVASLFPGDDVLDEDEKLVAAVKGGTPRVDRLTMTFPVLNHARDIVFMVSGKQKAGVVKTAVHPSGSLLPVHMIRPYAGKITWILDRDAAELI